MLGSGTGLLSGAGVDVNVLTGVKVGVDVPVDVMVGVCDGLIVSSR